MIFRYAFPPIVTKYTRPKKKNTTFLLFFYCLPTQQFKGHISGNNGPTETVHLSKVAEFNQENGQTAFKVINPHRYFNKRKQKCNLTLAMSPLCNSICPLPPASCLLFKTVISHVDGSNSMVLSSPMVLPVSS